MSLREKMNNNPAVATGASVVVLLICLLVIYCTFAGGGANRVDIVYFDVESKTVKLFEYKTGDAPPTSPLAGSETYRAQLFTCSECKEVTDGMTIDQLKAQDMFVGYLMRDSPNAAEDPFGETMEVRTVDGTKWIGADTEAGTKLVNQAMAAGCPSGNARQCGAKPPKE